MKWGKKTKFLCVLLAGTILTMVLALWGCNSKPEAPSESEVEQDLIASFVFASYFNTSSPQTSDFVVESRQTAPENNSDKVWVSIRAEDDEKSAELSFLMIYTLYNEGWKLEEITPSKEYGWEFAPLQGPSEEVIRTDLEHWEPFEVTSNDVKLYENHAYITAEREGDGGYYIVKQKTIFGFDFDPQSGIWSHSSSDYQDLGSSYDFSPVIGTWKYTEEVDEIDEDTGEPIIQGAELKINSIDPFYDDIHDASYTDELGALTGTLTIWGRNNIGDFFYGYKLVQGEDEYDLSESSWKQTTGWTSSSLLTIYINDLLDVEFFNRDGTMTAICHDMGLSYDLEKIE